MYFRITEVKMDSYINFIKKMNGQQFIKYVLRFGIACTFIGHGMNAIAIKPNWIPLLTVYGFSVEQSRMIMPLIGILDVIVALFVLIYPMRTVIMWTIFWAFSTALTRFIAGEGVWEFIERGANWTAPLALLLLSKKNKQEKVINFNRKEVEKIAKLNISIKNFISFFFLFFCFLQISAQTSADTSNLHLLQPVLTENIREQKGLVQLEDIKGTYIYSGKKTEVISFDQLPAALTEKYGRQIFSKVPGVFVYDMDGTGNQMNISTRGLDAHRGWEFNIRKDDILTNSDMYGYPASHYNIPMEAVDHIEIVRGTGALQYGAQFGGMLHYISKQPDSTKKISFESINTIGSFGLVSTFNSLSGKVNKFRYSAWINKKQIDGYRRSSDSKFDAAAISLFYDVSKKLQLKMEWTRSNYITHTAGPLTDKQFLQDPRTATRNRNYFNPDIHIPSFSINWKPAVNALLQLNVSAVIGARNSVLYDKPATVADSIVTATQQYNNRQVDIDHFNSYTTEVRMVQHYKLFSETSAFTAGLQYMNNDLHRQQLGKGTTGSDFDLTLITPGWGRDLHFKTSNVAAFIENHFVLSEKFSINAGARLEIGETHMTGITTYYADNTLPTVIKHQFPLFGISAQYNLTKLINFYGGYSDAYRPVIFKDIIPTSVYELTDKNLKDAFGYNLEAGFRGRFHSFNWDLTAFHLQYNNRLGTLAQQDDKGNLIIFRTNIGNSRTNGLELALHQSIQLGPKTQLSFFTATSFMDARYEAATIKSGNQNIAIRGNKVESVPEWISRNGATFSYSLFSFSALYSYTSSSFADALNTVEPSSTGATGIVPAYQLIDLTAAVRITKNINLQFNVSNLLNKHYFTKRPQFYPGPGVWPSDGRTFSGTVSVKI